MIGLGALLLFQLPSEFINSPLDYAERRVTQQFRNTDRPISSCYVMGQFYKQCPEVNYDADPSTAAWDYE